MEKNKNRVTTAESPLTILFDFMKFLGLDYNIKTEKSLMWYSSCLSKKMNNIIRRRLSRVKNKSQYSISLGTIARGISDNEPILSPEDLERNLKFVKQAGFNKTIIFRLCGLNKKYISTINKLVK